MSSDGAPVVHRGHALRYACDPDALPADLARRLVRLDLDEAGRAYIDRAIATRAGRARTSLHRWMLGYLSDFDANGLLGMYSMHLLGTEQWRRLIGAHPDRRHLDVGAGSGDITATLAPLSGEVVTTEISWAMARHLHRRGFECIRADIALSEVPRPPYGLITCLNVIDRCARPRTLLRKLRHALAPTGHLVLATPLPFEPFYYDGPRSLEPLEPLDIPGDTWEASVAALVERVLSPLGLEVEALARAPYLSAGDSERELYALDAAVVVTARAG